MGNVKTAIVVVATKKNAGEGPVFLLRKFHVACRTADRMTRATAISDMVGSWCGRVPEVWRTVMKEHSV